MNHSMSNAQFFSDLMRDTLDNRLRELPKGGHQSKKARR